MYHQYESADDGYIYIQIQSGPLFVGKCSCFRPIKISTFFKVGMGFKFQNYIEGNIMMLISEQKYNKIFSPGFCLKPYFNKL